MGGPPRTKVTLTARKTPVTAKAWYLRVLLSDCLGAGEPNIQSLIQHGRLSAGQVVALLAACRENGPMPPECAIAAALRVAPESVTADDASAALDESAAHRGFEGVLLVRNCAHVATVWERDLEMTLVVLSKNAERICMSSKRPVLERLSLNRKIETITVGTGI